MADGWIKLWRKAQDSDMVKKLSSKQRDVMIQCLLLANHQGRSWEWKGQLLECEPGQFITSLDSIKKRCAKDVSIQNIRTALLILEKWQFLTNESTKTGRLITVLNWDVYQGERQGEQQSIQQRANKELTTNKNVKNVKNKNKNKNNVVGNSVATTTPEPDLPALFENENVRTLVEQAIEKIHLTRKSGKAAPSVIEKFTRSLKQFDDWKVGTGLMKYLEGEYYLDGKDERYALGIVRNVSARDYQETVQKMSKGSNGDGRPKVRPRNYKEAKDAERRQRAMWLLQEDEGGAHGEHESDSKRTDEAHNRL